MADTSKPDQERKEPTPPTGANQETSTGESQPAQDWGERHMTGKIIARGGQTEGQVPGASQQS